MSKIFEVRHKEWGTTAVGDSVQECADKMGCKFLQDLEVHEMERSEYLLQSMPVELRDPLSMMAYDRGHSAGQQEVELILESLINNLKPGIDALMERLRS